MSWIIGRSAGSTQPSLGRVSLSLHSYQNPQFGMTINKISPSPHPSPTRGEGIKPPPRNQRFRSSRKGWTLERINVTVLNINTLHHINKLLDCTLHCYAFRGSLLQKCINFWHHFNCNIKFWV